MVDLQDDATMAGTGSFVIIDAGSNDGVQGTSWNPMPSSSIANRPEASVIRRL